jgi:hypothetical protein
MNEWLYQLRRLEEQPETKKLDEYFNNISLRHAIASGLKLEAQVLTRPSSYINLEWQETREENFRYILLFYHT